MTTQRYQRQLWPVARRAGAATGPYLVQSLALTGSDPYFRTGTDLAVLFEARDTALLEQLLLAQVALLSAQEPAAKSEQGEIAGVHYHVTGTPDRRVARISPASGRWWWPPIRRNSSSAGRGGGGQDALDRRPAGVRLLPQPLSAGRRAEDALVFLSDATIRRWCGPRWRIASSRRTRDAAVMAELQAAQLDRLVGGHVQPGPLCTDLATAQPEQFSLAAGGVSSSVEGTLDFLTPIAEMPLTRVTEDEAEAYRRWRNGYQRNWQWNFDPIALRLTVRKERLAGDLTIMPLILGSEYRPMLAVSRGAEFGPRNGDQHDALAQGIMAINTDSPPFRWANSLADPRRGAPAPSSRRP